VSFKIRYIAIAVARSREAGIRLADFAPETPEAVHNAVLRNVVWNAGKDGVLVEIERHGHPARGQLRPRRR
jgi:hypothetical protein